MQCSDYFLKMHDGYFSMVKDFVEIFMDDFSVIRKSSVRCLENLDRVLSRCKEINPVLNWEKGPFLVKEGIVLGHKVQREGWNLIVLKWK